MTQIHSKIYADTILLSADSNSAIVNVVNVVQSIYIIDNLTYKEKRHYKDLI